MGRTIFPFITAFPLLSLFFQLAYIWQLLIFSLNELKTSVSSRVAYLDYHCLLAQWMEVSISVTTAGFIEQTRNSKAALWLSLHQRSSPLLDIHYLVGFWKRHYNCSLIWSSMVCQIMTQTVENPTSWVLTETVDKPFCHVCSHFDVWQEVILCLLRYVGKLTNQCAICSDVVNDVIFLIRWNHFKEIQYFFKKKMTCIKFDTLKRINFLI